jgi:hypothetical protein
MRSDDFSLEELEAQHTAELPGRQLLTGFGVGIDVLGLAGLEVYVGTTPVELFAAVYM